MSIISASSQFLHCLVQPCRGRSYFYCTFIYAYNERNERIELWNALRAMISSDPCMIFGDLYYVMNVDERVGSLVRQIEMEDIRRCMGDCALEDIKSSGNF